MKLNLPPPKKKKKTENSYQKSLRQVKERGDETQFTTKNPSAK
jgi:hypothetical protein